MNDEMYGFGGKMPTPCSPEAEKLAEAVMRLIRADQEREAARARIPSYTAQWSNADYTAEEDEEWNRAAEALFAAMTPDPKGKTDD